MKSNKSIPSEIMNLIEPTPKSLEELLEFMDELAELRFNEMHITIPYSEALIHQREAVESGKYTKNDIDRLHDEVSADPTNHRKNYQYFGRLSLTFRIIAEKRFEEGMDASAIANLLLSALTLGASHRAIDIKKSALMDTSEKNAKAAKSKNQAYEKSRAFFIEKIAERKPSSGWITKAQMAATLSSEIRDHEINHLKIKVAEEDITDRLLRWTRSFDDVREAANKHVKRSAKPIKNPTQK